MADKKKVSTVQEERKAPTVDELKAYYASKQNQPPMSVTIPNIFGPGGQSVQVAAPSGAALGTGGPPTTGGLLGGMAPFDPMLPILAPYGAKAAPNDSPLAKAIGFPAPAPAPVQNATDKLADLKALASSLFPIVTIPGVDVAAAVKPFDTAKATAQQTADAARGAISDSGAALVQRLGELQGQANQNNQQINSQIAGDLSALLARAQAQNAPLINDLAKQGASPQSQAIAARAGVLQQGLEGQGANQQALANRLAQAQQNNNTSLLQSADEQKAGALGTLENNLASILDQIGVKRAGAEQAANAANAQVAQQNAQLAAQRAQGLFGLAGDLATAQSKSGTSPQAIIAPYVGRTDPFGTVVNAAIKELDDGTKSPEEVKAAINSNQGFKDAGFSPSDVAKIIDDYVAAKQASSVGSPDLMGIFRSLLGG